MKSDQLKEELVRTVLVACDSWPSHQKEQIDTALRIALHGLMLSKEETALSTEVHRPNEDYLKQFLAVKMVKGLSEKSLKLYANTVQRLFVYIDKPVPEMTANDIRYYLALRKSRDEISNVTLDSELRNLRSFFTTLHVEEMIPRNPTAKIDKVKSEKRTKEPFTELDVERLRVAAMNPRSSLTNGKRNLAIVETLYSTGCRVSELVNIKRKDVETEQVKVLGKGNKERYVYLNPRAQIAIETYLASRTDHFEWLFPGSDYESKGKVLLDKPIDKGTVEGMIRKLGKQAGIKNCHPHRFRRTAATIALRRGMPIEQVSRMLGHESITTTQIYAITADEDVQNSHRKYLT